MDHRLEMVDLPLQILVQEIDYKLVEHIHYKLFMQFACERHSVK